MTVDQNGLYREGCHALRHYSNGVRAIRTIAIGQGFVLISGAAYLINSGQIGLSTVVALFGVLFTYVLSRLQNNYWDHFNALLESVLQLEKRQGPWSAYAANRLRKHRRSFTIAILKHGPYVLLQVALAAVVVYGFWRGF